MFDVVDGICENKDWLQKIKFVVTDSDATQLKANGYFANKINPQNPPPTLKVSF